MSETARLTIGDQTLEMPVFRGTEDEVAIDISKLRGTTGAVAYDEGFANTAPCRSSITFLDGEKGILRYGGYSIEDVATRCTFLEAVYLVLLRELPTKAQLEEFENRVKAQAEVPDGIARMYEAMPANGHPMGMAAAATAALSCFYGDDVSTKEDDVFKLIAKFPTLTAYAFRRQKERPFVAPDTSLPYAGMFLKSMFARPGEPYDLDEDLVRTLDLILILHIDHEQNCSTSTVRLVGSSQANLYASISAGISALWGPLHGGANQKVLEMLGEIQAAGGDVGRFVLKAKDKDDPFRLMGFGHRVYKNFDPRATILKKQCDVVLAKLGIDNPLLDIAKRLERVALEDDYFVQRKLYPNVDFYSGILYEALGIPTNLFTVMFALGRLPGWIAQWMERDADDSRIGRPRQIYVGRNARKFVPTDAR